MALLHLPPFQSSGHLFTLTIAAPFLYLLWRVIYNLFFHPLRSYPGPLLWRMSSIPMSYYVYMGTLPQALHKQHKIYGKEVRIGPDEISITDSQAWKEVYTAKQEFPKDPRKIQYPPNGSHSILTGPREEHARFRRLLSHAFSDKGLREQEPRIKQYVDLLINRLGEKADSTTSVDIVNWYTCAVFDVIGELAWGGKTTSQSRIALSKTLLILLR